jgi:hypothetical protein
MPTAEVTSDGAARGLAASGHRANGAKPTPNARGALIQMNFRCFDHQNRAILMRPDR